MMSVHWRQGCAAALGLAGTFVLSLPALADPPGRVGRLSEMTGVVSFHSGDADQWSPAVPNEPVTSGDSFWTEPNARSEIRVGSTALHMDGSTELDIAVLDDHQLQATLPQGTINLRILHIPDGDSYSIATPRGTVMITNPGTYHISAGTETDPTDVGVLEGAAQFVGATSSLRLTRGEAGIVSGTDPIAYDIEEAQPTPFDNEVLVAERREERPPPRYVSPEMTGAEDLEDHGTWQSDAAYGQVWYPQAVPADWAPYRYGHWAWVDPWGWTWIDDQPWGFAPFHYGRWAYIHDRWGWCPGTVVARPVYAPALVTFIGGAGWSLSLSIGAEAAVGWFPLAPREVYVPSYPASVTYVRQVNVTNVRNVTNITNTTINNINVTNVTYANRSFATVVPQTALATSRPISKAVLSVPQNQIASAPVSHHGVPITPEAAAAAGHPAAVVAARTVAASQPQGRVLNTSVSGGPALQHQASTGNAPIATPAAPASPGPPIVKPHTTASAEPAPAQTPPGTAPKPAPAAAPATAHATPAPGAAPGPPIRHDAARAPGQLPPLQHAPGASNATAEKTPPGNASQGNAPQANAPVVASTGPQSAHTPGQASTPAPSAPTPPVAHAPTAPVAPHATPQPAKSSPPPQTQVASRTPAKAPPPPKAT
ncbi:MAG: hypothetical protein JO255_21215, partial [Alphaproteobacteria bacterium]|nr:hypothetical protein [Alphaproteobacteria bacterium]